MKARRVMVVDDDADIRINIAMALQSEDYEVLEAEHGARALEVLRGLPREELPGCIILDLMMPKMDGSTFMQVLAKEHAEDLAKIKIIVASAQGYIPQPIPPVLKVEKLKKPFELDVLFQLISQHCP